MLSKMKSHSCSAHIKLKNACSTLKLAVHSSHKSRKEQRVRKCVLDLLQLYDPDKVCLIDELMIEWKNREMQLLQHLHQEYHLTDVGLTYFKSKYSRLFELPSIYKGTFCRQCIRRSNGEQRLYHRLYKKRVTPYTIKKIKYQINILRKLNNSPNIVKLYDIFESRTRLVLITDLFHYNNCSLPISLLNKINYYKLNESIIANIFNQMLQIISYIHSKQYIHCNLNIDSFIIESWTQKTEETEEKTADNDDNNDDNDDDEEEKKIDLNEYDEPEPFVKLIRVDQCTFLPDLATKTDGFDITNQRYAPPEIINFDKYSISQQSDMWSLGILLYVMLTGMLPKQIPMIRCSNKQTVELEYELKFDHNKMAWNHLSFHARDLITKLIQKEATKRLTIKQCLDHPWIRRYKNGYLKYNNLWDGYQDNLKKYQFIQKLRNGIKKLLLIKDCLGLMDDYILANHVRAIINNWSTTFEQKSIYHVIVPSHIKELIVDFA